MADKEELLEQLKEAIDDEEEDAIEELSDKLIEAGFDIKDDVIEGLSEAVIEGEDEWAEAWANIAVKAGIDAYTAMIEGLASGMAIMGERYDKGEAFVPNLLISASAMYAGMDILSPHLHLEGDSKPATVVIGTVEGDVHDIGKNLVKTMMTAAGFTMVDLGNDVPIEKFVETAKENQADVISISTLMTTTMPGMPKTIHLLQEEGLRDTVTVMVGGAPITPAFAENIKADGTAGDAASAKDWLIERMTTVPANSERWSKEFIDASKAKWADILANEVVEEEVDEGLESAKVIMAEFEDVVPKFASTMTGRERATGVFEDKKLDRLAINPLTCGMSRKFVPTTLIDYCTSAESYANCAYNGSKYLNQDAFVGLTDLAVIAADLGTGVRYPEEDTPAATGHIAYEDIVVPELKEGTRAWNLIQGNKLAVEKMHSIDKGMVSLVEGAMVALTQTVGASQVLADIKTDIDKVNKYLDIVAEYEADIVGNMMDTAQPDAHCMVNLWTNNLILSEDEWWNTHGRILQKTMNPLFKEHGYPYVMHNCADAPHWNLIDKFECKFYSYSYYPDEHDKGSLNHKDLIPVHAKNTVLNGEINPVNFMDASPEGLANVEKLTDDLYNGALTALKEEGLQSKYVLSTGCEVPPNASVLPLKTFTYKIASEGPDIYKKIMG